jgi:limonene-1,2-epoxide hydrolase
MGHFWVLAASMLTLAAASMPASAASVDDTAKLAVARTMIEAWNNKDWNKVVNLFTPDGSLNSMMVQPIIGREAIGRRLATLTDGLETIRLNIRNMGVINGQVFLERQDEFVFKGKPGKVPVVGVLVIEGGLVKEWREYYDRAELLQEMGIKTDFDSHAR